MLMDENIAESGEEVDRAEEMRISVLNALGLSLASKRAEAKTARAASGIEDEWQGDEEFYQGYDDANRHEFVKTTNKPTASGVSSDPPVKPKGSTVFPNITQPYVDAGAARVGDMLLPTGDRNFAVEPTPIPEMGELAQPVIAQPGVPGAMPAPEDQAKQVFEKIKAEAARKAEKAQTRIDDWLTESNYHNEVRKMIDDAARLGSGVMKGPIPIKCKSRKWAKDAAGNSVLQVIEEIKPGSQRVDPWNLFPDPACGESIHNGSYIFERDYLTARQLEDLKGLPGYIDSQIDKCLEEGAKQAEANPHRDNAAIKDQFEVWYYHGQITAEEMEAVGCECDKEEAKRGYPVKITMVNDYVIRAALNPLDSGEFPYDVVPWKRRPNMPWGMGIARQARTPQRMVVAATRNLMNNAGRAAGPQFVVRRGVVPQDGVWEIRPDKIWVEGEDSDGQAGSPFLCITVPMLQAEITNIIQLGMKMAEDVTGLPMLLQGQQGKAPDTVGGMQILNNNGNAVLRRIARLFDVFTESHVRRYYAWLMEYGEDEDEKGDFQIVARGSTALVERDIQNQEMVQVLNLSLNPLFKKSPAKAIDEYLKSRRFDPAAFDYTEEELAEMAKQQPPEDPRITAAKIMAEARIGVEQLQAKEEADHAVAQAQLELNRQKFEAAEADKDRQLELVVQQVNERIAAIKEGTAKEISLMELKGMLAATSAKLNVQKDLSVADHMVNLHKGRQVIIPPTEPAGRAAPGRAFQA